MGGSIPGWEDPLEENAIFLPGEILGQRGHRRATVYGVTKNQTRLSMHA